jgi:hypothetical protein
MKTIKLALISLLTSIASSNLYAVSTCPTDVYAQYGNFTAPTGWHVTSTHINIQDPEVASNPNFRMSFYSAQHNAQHGMDNASKLDEVTLQGSPEALNKPFAKIAQRGLAFNEKPGPNNNKISCFYISEDSHSSVEITTDQEGFKNPIAPGTKWIQASKDSALCGVFAVVETLPSECPWN